MKTHQIIFIIFVTTYFLMPSLGSRIITVLPKVNPDEVSIEMKENKTKNMMQNDKVNNDKVNKEKFTIIKHICPFLTVRDLSHCIVVSKNFNICITTYLETCIPYFGLIDLTNQLEKYKPEIEQISDQEKIISIKNPNPNEDTEIMIHINREHFYFPFSLEFSQIPILLNTNNTEIIVFPRNTRDDKKLTFSPRTNTIFFDCSKSVKFKSISKLKFKLSPVQEIEKSVVTLKYKVEKQNLINVLQKWIKRRNVCVFVLFFLLCVWYLVIAPYIVYNTMLEE